MELSISGILLASMLQKMAISEDELVEFFFFRIKNKKNF